MFEVCRVRRCGTRWRGCGPPFDAVAACDLDALTREELIGPLDELETLWCALPALRHRMLARLQVEATPPQMGAKNWKDVLATRWRISGAEAGRRLADAALLGPRRALTGQPLAPVLAATAAAQAAGVINAEHVEEIRKAVAKLPGFVDAATREQFETDLVDLAVGVGPKERQRRRRAGAVSARSGRPRTRRRRTGPQTRRGQRVSSAAMR